MEHRTILHAQEGVGACFFCTQASPVASASSWALGGGPEGRSHQFKKEDTILALRESLHSEGLPITHMITLQNSYLS